MKFNFKLLLKSTLPENGFSLDELVIATKTMFETDGMVGFLRVLIEILDQAMYLTFLGPCEHSCCDNSHFVKDRKETKNIMTSVGSLQFEKLSRHNETFTCSKQDLMKKLTKVKHKIKMN